MLGVSDATSTKSVLSSSWVREAWPIHFFRLCFTEWTMHSQNPPHQGALSTINFQVAQLEGRCLTTSGERLNFWTTLEAVLKVLALSDHMVEGNLLLPTKRQNANKNDSAESKLVSSRCIALVEQQVNRHTYTIYLGLIRRLIRDIKRTCKIDTDMSKGRVIRH